MIRLLLLLVAMVSMPTRQTRPRKWPHRTWHIAKNIFAGYAIENSNWATRIAKLLRFSFIDKDIHVTKDGVPVCGHWGVISKNRFVLPMWFLKKYGAKPQIKNVYWEDLRQLRTVKVSYRGVRRTFRFIALKGAMSFADRIGMGIMAEQKGGAALRKKETWEEINSYDGKVAAATLPSMSGALAVLKAATAAKVPTIVLLRGKVPVSWAPYITFYKGTWRGWDYTK